MHLMGESKNIREAKSFIQQVVQSNAPILLLGPTGSGKEVMAREIHHSSKANRGKFIVVNCASLNENLVESELFGHERGSFTGATQNKPGKFELAEGGILFLDEVGELSLSMQAKLLRVLQEKEFTRLGGVDVIKFNARIIAATHRDLPEMVKAGTFREDLYFRLNVLYFELLPLSQRREDIPVLLQHYWKAASAKAGINVEISDAIRTKLANKDYPGNVRELINTLERLLVFTPQEGKLDEGQLFLQIEATRVEAKPKTLVSAISQWKELGFSKTVEYLEASLIESAMEECGQNQVRAAQQLKLDRSTLRYKLKKYRNCDSAP